MGPLRLNVPDLEGLLLRLAEAWSNSPPEPDLAQFLPGAVLNQSQVVVEVVRLDARERVRRGLPVRVEWYRDALPAGVVGPGTPVVRLLLEFEGQAGESAASVRARIGDAYAADIDAVLANVDPDSVQTLDNDAVLGDVDPDAVQTLDNPTLAPDANADSTSDSLGPLAPGSRLGPYELRRRLGAGGFGEVWLARRQHPELDVAIKVLQPGVVSDRSLRRFEGEAQALAFLEHRYIARIHDAGTAGGIPFIAMEFVDGRPLLDYCDDRRFTLEQRLELMVRVCEGVQHAHQRGLIHRDLKPDNILVTEVVLHASQIDAHDRRLVVSRHQDTVTMAVPKIVDFGLAKGAEQSVRLSDGTMTGDAWGILGTPEYMAPEQAGAELHLVTQKADIFALGVVLYELLSGTLPLSRAELRKRALNEIVDILRSTPRPEPATCLGRLEPEMLSRVSTSRGGVAARELTSRLRSRVRHLCGKAMRLEPDKRFSSAAMLALDIRNYLSDRDFEEAAAEPAWDRWRRNIRRHRVAYAAVIGILVALAGGMAGTTSQWWRAESALRTASENAEALAGFTTMILDNVVADEDMARSPLKVAEGFSGLVGESLQGEVIRDPLVRANMYWRLGQLNLRIGRIEEAIGPLERSIAMFAELGRQYEEAMVRRDLSVVFFRREDGDRSRAEADRSLELLRASLAPSDPALFDALEGVGHAMKWSNDHDAARTQYEAVIDLRENGGQSPLEVAETQFDLALVMERIARETDDRAGLLEATELMSQVHQVRQEAIGQGTPDEPLLAARAELARMLTRCWRAFRNDPGFESYLEDALDWYDLAIEDGHRVLGGTHWRVVQWEYNRGSLLVDSGDVTNGFEEMERCFDLYWRMRDANLATQCGVALASKYGRHEQPGKAADVASRVMDELDADSALRDQVPESRMEAITAFLR